MSAQQMALPLAAPRIRPALVYVRVPAAPTAQQREQLERLIARLVDWPQRRPEGRE